MLDLLSNLYLPFAATKRILIGIDMHFSDLDNTPITSLYFISLVVGLGIIINKILYHYSSEFAAINRFICGILKVNPNFLQIKSLTLDP